MSRFKKNQVFLILYILLVSSVIQFVDHTSTPGFNNYFFAALTVAMIAVIVFPPFEKWPLLSIIGGWALAYLALWFVLGWSFASGPVTILLVELAFLAAGIAVVRETTLSFREMEKTIEKLVFSSFSGRALMFEEAEKVIQTELARSRRYSRPLSLVIIEPDPVAVGAEFQPAPKEIQQQLARRYVMAQIAEILDKEARHTDIIVKQNKPDRFIILCPETQTSNTNTLIRRVVEKTRAQIGLQVGFGVAAFPEEALTFEELLQKAEAKMVKPGAFSLGK
jgi:GGDEF domain-containing protein